MKREQVDISELTFSVKCGESDTTLGLAANPTVGKVIERSVAEGATAMFGETTELTGGENIVADRMKTPALKEKFNKIFKDYADFVDAQDADLLGSQPTEGNIIGNPVVPVIKLSGNPLTCSTMSEHIEYIYNYF